MTTKVFDHERMAFVTAPRRDYDAVEREMIRNGDAPGAKVRWHARQPKKESK